MQIERFQTGSVMHNVVLHNQCLYLSGQTCEDPIDFTEQVEGVFEKIEQLLSMHGSDKHHILSAVVYLRDQENYNDFNIAWKRWLDADYYPARTCVIAPLCRPSIQVEVTITAAISS